MEIEVIKDKYNYKYCICTNCQSELKIKKNDIQYYYKSGYMIANIICPCCNQNFITHK